MALDDWRLPSPFDFGTDVVCRTAPCFSSEMGHLQGVDGFGIFQNLPPTVSIWTSVEVAESPSQAWVWSTTSQYHRPVLKTAIFGASVWLLRDGDVASLPEPGMASLLVCGWLAVGIASSRR